MLAATSIGAIWSSCSPDFGLNGVYDRFGQIAPKVLFATDGYFYNGKEIDSLPRVREIAARLDELQLEEITHCIRQDNGLCRACTSVGDIVVIGDYLPG